MEVALPLTAERGFDQRLRGLNLAWMGEAQQSVGRMEDSERNLREAMRVFEREHPRYWRDELRTLFNLLTLYLQTAQPARAEAVLQKAAGFEGLLPEGSPELSRLMVSTASLELLRRNYVSAEGKLLRALIQLEKAGDRKTADYGVVLNQLAVTEAETGRLEPACEHLKQALAIVEVLPGAAPTNVAKILFNLTSYQASAGHHAEAEQNLLRVLKILERSVEPDHPWKTSALFQYADLLNATRRKRQAKQIRKQAQALVNGRQESPLERNTVNIKALALAGQSR